MNRGFINTGGVYTPADADITDGRSWVKVLFIPVTSGDTVAVVYQDGSTHNIRVPAPGLALDLLNGLKRVNTTGTTAGMIVQFWK